MATWAHTTTEDEYTLEHFRTVAPVVREEDDDPAPAA